MVYLLPSLVSYWSSEFPILIIRLQNGQLQIRKISLFQSVGNLLDILTATLESGVVGSVDEVDGELSRLKLRL